MINEFETTDEQAISDNSASKKETLDAFLAEYTKPEYLSIEKSLDVIAGTHEILFEGGVHCVHGLSGEGKTYFVLGLLNALAAERRVLWLDGDNNGKKMGERFANVHHIPPVRPSEWLDRLLDCNATLEGVIIILDAMKDFNFEYDLDNNKGSNEIMQKYKILSNKGATIIVITHSTLVRSREKDAPNEIKLRGNEEGIKSNSDIVYLYERDWEKKQTTLTVQKSRVDGMVKGDKFKIDSMGTTKLALTDNSVSKNETEEEVITWKK